MHRDEVLSILEKKLFFTRNSINKLLIFHKSLLEYNNKYNLISKSTEKLAWHRHILDSAQIVKYIGPKVREIADFGTGAGFPGLVISIFNEKNTFHVKLYEKSPVKRDFLKNIRDKLKLTYDIIGNIYDQKITSDLIVCRAFKKMDSLIKISRENIKKPHKIIILKGKNAQTEINNISFDKDYSYKLVRSITDKDSKIIIVNVKK